MVKENELKEKDGCKPSAPVDCSTIDLETVLNRALELIWCSGTGTVDDIRHQLIEEFGEETISLMRAKYGF